MHPSPQKHTLEHIDIFVLCQVNFPTAQSTLNYLVLVGFFVHTSFDGDAPMWPNRSSRCGNVTLLACNACE